MGIVRFKVLTVVLLRTQASDVAVTLLEWFLTFG